MNLGERAVRGLVWGYGTFVVERVANLAITIVLARLLVPAEFGLFAGAALIVGLIDAFGQMGIREALIYAPQHGDRTRSTGFFLDLAIGVLQWGTIFACAPLGVHFIDDPRIVPILQTLAFAPLISSLSRTQEALLQRELYFRRRYICDVAAVLVKTAVALACAYRGLGVWSLVVAQISSMGTRTVLQWIFTGWRPGFSFSFLEAKTILSYGVHILIVNLIALAANRSDQFFIGGMLGQVSLGYYFIGVRIPELIVFSFGNVLSQIIFPILVRARSCRETLTNSFLATTRWTAYAVVPLALGIVSVAPELTRACFGDNWNAAVPVMQIFGLVGLVRMLPWVAGDAFKALGRPDLMTRLSLFTIAVTVPILWGFIYFGRDVVSAAWAALLASSIGAAVRLWSVSRFLEFRLAAYVPLFGKPFAAGTIMVAAVWGWRTEMDGILTTKILLATSVGSGMIAYVAAVWLLDRPLLREGWAFLRGMLAAPKAPAMAFEAVPARPPEP